jgi:hypothetical protein
MAERSSSPSQNSTGRENSLGAKGQTGDEKFAPAVRLDLARGCAGVAFPREYPRNRSRPDFHHEAIDMRPRNRMFDKSAGREIRCAPTIR